jgi:hypothetical protein
VTSPFVVATALPFTVSMVVVAANADPAVQVSISASAVAATRMCDARQPTVRRIRRTMRAEFIARSLRRDLGLQRLPDSDDAKLGPAAGLADRLDRVAFIEEEATLILGTKIERRNRTAAPSRLISSAPARAREVSR